MPDRELLRARLEELTGRDWNLPAIEARLQRLMHEGMRKRPLAPDEVVARKQEILDRVQLRAEEYCYAMRSCAKGSATALLEEFGLGNTECIKALAAFPGLGMTGEICGPVSGGLTALGLCFSGETITGVAGLRAYPAAREFLKRFNEVFGSLRCRDIQTMLLGKYHDPLSGMESLEEFNKAGAREKCALVPGLGARIAAEIMIENMEGETAS
jgi:C_GCAxxG_C_C family probable redox protein